MSQRVDALQEWLKCGRGGAPRSTSPSHVGWGEMIPPVAGAPAFGFRECAANSFEPTPCYTVKQGTGTVRARNRPTLEDYEVVRDIGWGPGLGRSRTNGERNGAGNS